MASETRPALRFGIFDHMDDAGGSPARLYADRLRLAEACDAAGFYSYHVAEHHGTPHGLAPSPNLFLAALAQRTTRMRLGPLLMLLPLYHPVRALEEICMLDQLSQGRLDLGIGRGSHPVESGFFGIDPTETAARLQEATGIILAAMTEAALNHRGPSYAISDMPIAVLPFQKPHPPLWYGALHPQSAIAAADRGANIASFGRAGSIRAVTDAFRARWAETRQAPLPLLGLSRHIVVAGSDAEARALAGPAYDRWFETLNFLWERNGLDMGKNVPASLDAATESGFCIVGSAGAVAERVQQEVAEAGVNYLLCQVAFGDLPLAASLATVEAIRTTVMPACNRVLELQQA